MVQGQTASAGGSMNDSVFGTLKLSSTPQSIGLTHQKHDEVDGLVGGQLCIRRYYTSFGVFLGLLDAF